MSLQTRLVSNLYRRARSCSEAGYPASLQHLYLHKKILPLQIVQSCYRKLCIVVTEIGALLLPKSEHSIYHFLCTRRFCLHRCQLVRSGYYQLTTYQIRYFQPDGKGKLEMDDGTVFLPNDLYPLEKETFRLYYTSASTDQQTIDIYIIDSFGQMQQLSLSFNNDNSDK